MRISVADRIFDTVVDTEQIYVSMKHYFRIRKNTQNPEKALVYLHITAKRQPRERINYDITVNSKDWNDKEQKLVSSTRQNQDINLILENIKSKITDALTRNLLFF
jgi:integrase/recombinase XerD